jgi:hypothetical protein
MQMSCIVCNNDMKIFIKYDENFIDKQLCYCNCCYHVKNINFDEEVDKHLFQQDRVLFHDFILRSIKMNHNGDGRDINILNIIKITEK